MKLVLPPVVIHQARWHYQAHNFSGTKKGVFNYAIYYLPIHSVSTASKPKLCLSATLCISQAIPNLIFKQLISAHTHSPKRFPHVWSQYSLIEIILYPAGISHQFVGLSSATEINRLSDTISDAIAYLIIMMIGE